jgi:hypothetical protein
MDGRPNECSRCRETVKWKWFQGRRGRRTGGAPITDDNSGEGNDRDLTFLWGTGMRHEDIGEREAAADHEAGHALVGGLEAGWDHLERASIEESNEGWGGSTYFYRPIDQPDALWLVALAGTLAEGKGAMERQGCPGDLLEHETHAQNVRAALHRLARDVSSRAERVEIHVAEQISQAAISRKDSEHLARFNNEGADDGLHGEKEDAAADLHGELVELIRRTSSMLNKHWVAHVMLAERLLHPPAGEDPAINHTHVVHALTSSLSEE